MTYESQQGMVKFRSDLTFDLGSAEVKDEARASLKKLAGIIDSPMAGEYTACIVGHTDNVPISKPSTKAQHPTNWHLSVHRAIAVMEELQKAGVPSARMGVAGYGEYRPVAGNQARSGNAANRRVEIYIVKGSDPAAAAQTAAPSTASVNAIEWQVTTPPQAAIPTNDTGGTQAPAPPATPTTDAEPPMVK
jgi:chemotaxis protein MotB